MGSPPPLPFGGSPPGLPNQSVRKRESDVGAITIGIIGLVGAVFLLSRVDLGAPRASAPTATQTVEQKQRADDHFAAALGLIALRSSLRDPDSFVLEGVAWRSPAKHICYQFRTKNGFGGYNRETMIFSDHRFFSGAELPSLWNADCTGDGLESVQADALIREADIIASELGPK